jgi:hypothetical protein
MIRMVFNDFFKSFSKMELQRKLMEPEGLGT